MGYEGNYINDAPDWNADEDNVAEPSSSKKDNGWEPQEHPPAQWINWCWNKIKETFIELDDALKSEEESRILHEENENNPHETTPDLIGAETPSGAQDKVNDGISDMTSNDWNDYEIQKNGTDGSGIINFKT